MKILVACEFSGIVRDAFIQNGHDAISCDLLPSERPGRHYQGDVRDILKEGWDMMIAHPPCTYLSVSGIHWNHRIHGREKKTEEAIIFVKTLLEADIPLIALENPVSVISTRIRKPDQYVHPHQFGHPESKKTGLWLKNLPHLKPTDVLTLPRSMRWNNQTISGQNKLAPSTNRWKDRSRTYKGIALAMASQWGK